MTLAVLRALQAILADAIDDIQRVYVPEHTVSNDDEPVPPNTFSYASPPPSPSSPGVPLDFPSLDAPYDPSDPAEQLTAHPVVVRAINRIVAAAGQMAITVQAPFYALCDASMGYHLPSCLRLLEASHTVEILREAGPEGLHVDLLSQRNGVESGKLAHILRLLATHHFIRETSPNVFATNRISSLLDSGKSVEDLQRWEREGRPELKYHDTDGVAAFVGMCTDELFKSSAYLTEAYLLERSDPPRPPFQYALATRAGFFAWLEGEDIGDEPPAEPLASNSNIKVKKDAANTMSKSGEGIRNPSRFRLERFGTAMSGTGSWEAPGAVLNGLDWGALPHGSVIVDVGGGIGSTSMFLANELADQDQDLHFVIQDRAVVVEMGEKAWRVKCPELLESGTARFQVHDFFKPQPIKNAAVYFLRVVLHDWPDAQARLILLRLREAAAPETRLVLGDFVLPLACVDVDVDGTGDGAGAGVLDAVEGKESTLAHAPLLANLGKASANAYWMDLTMQVMFNSQERTLRETTALCLSAGWKVVRVTRAPGSLFGHIVAVPVSVPVPRRARAGSGSAFFDVPNTTIKPSQTAEEVLERASSRCGTPTFGSRMDLPSIKETMARFGGGVRRSRLPGRTGAALQPPVPQKPGILKQSAVITPTSAPGTTPMKKKKPSPLSLPPPSSPSPALASPKLSQPPTPIKRRMSLAQLRPPSQQGPVSPVSPMPISRGIPPSPMSPRHPQVPPPPVPPPSRTLTRRASHAQLTARHSPSSSVSLRAPSQHVHSPGSPVPLARQALCSPISARHPQPLLQSPPPPPLRRLTRRASHAQLLGRDSPPMSLSPAAVLLPSPPLHLPSQSQSQPRLELHALPVSPRHPTLSRTVSHAQLHQTVHKHAQSLPSVIPVRSTYTQNQDQEGSAATAPRPPYSHSQSPRTPRTIPRRASYAQLPQSLSGPGQGLRKRSGSGIGGPLAAGIGVGVGAGVGMASLLERGTLDFVDVVNSKSGQGEEDPGDTDAEMPFGGARSVLEAAARIERNVCAPLRSGPGSP
ncbi:hypothetical protein H0H81_000331 [Sphagnurus paluster]|uniref:O-methyltransferase C-terminal domain-containing protein n=1 Tax=Sphagnurus paluster TaxID=117069 RepID=A0A9P7K328_9AGAR|nr:hypothetical protein H0H81_000331 [Sphagnurus paluster]